MQAPSTQSQSHGPKLPTAKALDKTAMPRGANVKPKDRGSQ